MTARFIIGDSLTVLRSMPDASVDLVLTSPPFLALRSYLPPDHPDKVHEMGSEATPGEFLDALLDVIEECSRVLAPHGSIAIELGDTYAGSGGAGGDYDANGLRDGQAKFNGSGRRGRLAMCGDGRGNPDGMRDTTFSGANTRSGGGNGWPLEKSLCLIPEIFRFALVYGFNPLTGRETPRWRARNVVRWVRPNPPVGALADKWRPATSELVIACKSRKRYFDLDATREPLSAKTNGNLKAPNSVAQTTARSGNKDNAEVPPSIAYGVNPAAGAPPLDWWVIPPGGYSGAHYAVFPEALCVRPIKAMCPERVCTTCGKPSERIVKSARRAPADDSTRRKPIAAANIRSGVSQDVPEIGWEYDRETTGWTDCGHDSYRNGVTLDPFAGSGTTLAVATGHGRDAVGIDLDERNAELARQRVGMWLEVSSFTDERIA